MKRWNKVKQAHALTNLKPRLSQRLQHLVVNDVNAQTLCSNRHCPLQAAPIFYPRIPHIFIQSDSKENMGSLACNDSWVHELIIQKKQKCLNRYELFKHSGFQAWISVRPARMHPNVRTGGQNKVTKDSVTTSESKTLTYHHATNVAWRPMLCVVTQSGHHLQLASSSFSSS